MLFLANLNLGYQQGITFKKACADSLHELGLPMGSPLDLEPNSVDVILTNPPFGVSVNADMGTLDLFGTRQDVRMIKIPSEVLFINLCLRLLRPGGRLGIILPRSVITNERLAKQRQLIDQVGYLTKIVDLPPETFASSGALTTTVAALLSETPPGTRAKTCSSESMSCD